MADDNGVHHVKDGILESKWYDQQTKDWTWWVEKIACRACVYPAGCIGPLYVSRTPEEVAALLRPRSSLHTSASPIDAQAGERE